MMTDQNCEIKLCPITISDARAVFEVYRQCEDFLALGPQPQASIDMVLKDIGNSENQNGIFYGIYLVGGGLIGVLSLVPQEIENEVVSANLDLLMISAPFRHKGIGTRILKVIESEIKQKTGISQFGASVQVNNPAALRFWQKNGYRITSGPELQPDSTTVYHLKKDIEFQCSPN
jgi:RimJ/RimL family protein N-acetyltransferase